MKRIALLVVGLLLVAANTAEARRSRGYSGSYSQPVYTAPAVTALRPVQPAPAAAQPAAVKVSPATHTTSTSTTAAKTVSATTTVAKTTAASAGFSTATAQGVANIMASRGYVGHFGGNPGYEGCGMASTPQGAYNICCYANSGMATVDVGYAQGANGMWYCCRRYR